MGLRSRASGRVAQIKARRSAMGFYRHFVRPGGLCFDVGANVGQRSSIFLALHAGVVAVEPQPECLHQLEKLAERHPSLAIEPLALGRVNGRADLHVATASTLSSLEPEWIDRVRASGRFEQYQWPSVVNVEVTTLDALIARHGRPDFTKIDVEGHEAEVVAGLSEPLPLISFEFTAEWRQSAVDVIEHLQTLGMDRFNVSMEESFRLTSDSWQSGAEMMAYLESIPEDDLTWGDIYAASDGGDAALGATSPTVADA